MAEPQWHYYFDRTQDGPLSQDALTRRFGERLVPLHALVWSDTWKTDEWRPARDVDAFRRAASAPPLKPPAAVPAPMRAFAPKPRPTLPPKKPLPPLPKPVPVPMRAAAAQVARLILPPPGPWARFWARVIDFVACGNVLLALLVRPLVPGLSQDSYLAQGIVGPLCWMFVEILLINEFGTTPGKWAFDIQVQTPGGELPDFRQSARRGASVFFRGLAAMIPPFALAGIIVAFYGLMRDGQTAWDRGAGLTVVRRGSGWLGWTLLTLGLCAATWAIVTTWPA